MDNFDWPSFIVGAMAAWMPALIYIGWLLWLERDAPGLRKDEETPP